MAKLQDTLLLYARYVGVSVRSQMQYRASFVMLTFATMLISGLEFVATWALFDRFGSLAGWTLPEAALLYGLVNMAFALAEGWARGFDEFGQMVKSGGFDRLLLRPRSTALQVAGHHVQLMRIGRLAQGAVVFIWAATRLQVAWSPPRVLLCLLAIAGGAALFSGLMVLQATFAFWSTESLEVFNTVTYGGVETTQYPLTVYRDGFRRFFTYVVPLATVTYYPALAVLGRSDPLGSSLSFQYASPLFGFLFLIVCLRVWNLGVRHYHSTGS
ncbi:MAG: ABC transporter permease [Chloroflexi bacterium]|nr:ABC transporter permease [Chloroflexota bacterium]